MATTLTGAEEITWDLSDLYAGPDDPRIDSDVEEALSVARDIAERYHGKVAELSAAEIFAVTKQSEEIFEKTSRAYIYSYLLFSADTSDPPRGALLQKMREKMTELNTTLLFFGLEWVALDEDRAELLLEDPVLEKYRHYLASQRRFKPYLLSEPEEKIISEKMVTGAGAWDRLFDEVTAVITVDIDGEEFSFEQAFAQLHDGDRETRRKAQEAITEALRDGLRTRAFIFNTILLDKATDDRLRGYSHWLAARNLSNEASDEAVQALVDAVVDRYDIPQRYYRLKAKMLGLDRLKDYDRSAAIESTSVKMSWPEARDLVVGAYASFSDKAGEIISDFFDRRWIDAGVTPNKMTGAYCYAVPQGHPFVMMNYTGERRAALTLAHELGHGLHGVLAEPLGAFNSDTPLTMSETASVFGEALTFRHLLETETTERGQLELLAGRIEDAIATVFRQISMNRFEDVVHNDRRTSGEISVDRISDLWFETQSSMFADSVELTDGYRIWWSYVPHFIGTPGYVYAYAFGFLFSLAIFRKYEDEGDVVVEPYLNLLRAGGSNRPDELAKIVGLDITDPKFWHGGLEEIDALVTEAESMLSS